ncbi:APC family permease [Nocardioides sp. YJ-D4]
MIESMQVSPDGVRPAQERRRLARVLGPGAAVLLVLSCITPASSLFIIVPELFATQGSGAVLAVVAGFAVSIAIAACYAELGTRTASSGGEYAMVTQTLGKSMGWLTFSLAGVLLWLIPPIFALGTADYLADLVELPRAATGAIVMLLSTATAILNIKANAVVTGTFLALEMIAAVVVVVLGLGHVQRGPGELVSPHVIGENGLEPFTLAILISGLAVSTFLVSGFGTTVYLSEEIVDPRRNVARVIFWTLGLGGLVILIPTVTTVLAVDDLSDLASGNFSQWVAAWGGERVAVAVNVAIAIAILNAVIVMVLQNARVVYASARDRSWPAPVNNVLTKLHPRYATPWLATLVIGIPGTILAGAVEIESLLGVTSVVMSTMYVVVAIAALRARRLAPAAESWRMPLWPLPPLVVIGAIGYALAGSARMDVLITAGVVVAALAYYYVYLARRPGERFLVVDPTED